MILELFIILEPLLTPVIMIFILYYPYFRLLKKENSIVCILKRDKRSQSKILFSVLAALAISAIISRGNKELEVPFIILIVYCITLPAYPQIVCESGVIGPNFFVKWSNIECIRFHANTIVILLKKAYFFNRKYKISCNQYSRDEFLATLKKKSNIIIKEENI